jgi:hypothetical protein
MSGSSQQRLQMLEQGRDDQLEAIASGTLEQQTPQFLDTPRLGWKHISNVLGQQPG